MTQPERLRLINFEIDGVVVIWPRALASLIRADADEPPGQAPEFAHAIGQRFRPAS
jgi:hypothetical protein